MKKGISILLAVLMLTALFPVLAEGTPSGTENGLIGWIVDSSCPAEENAPENNGLIGWITENAGAETEEPAAPDLFADPAFDGAAELAGEWYCIYMHTGTMDLVPAERGLDIRLVLFANGRATLDYPVLQESTWGPDANGVLHYNGNGCTLSVQNDGTAVLGTYESGYMMFSRDKNFKASVFPAPRATATPAPTAVPTPVPTPEPAATPAPQPVVASVLEEGVDRFAEAPAEIPGYWEKLEIVNEQTGIVFSVYVPLDKETDMKLKIPSANYDMNGYIRCNVSYTVGGTMSNGYSVWGLYASAEEREILKYLNGAEYAGDQEYTYERIQNANGVVMGRTGRIAGGKVQYCAIGPVFEDGSRVIMKATLTVAPEDTDAAWFREICDAFERTVCLTAGAAAEMPAPTAEPAPAVTAAPAAGPSPVPTEAPTPAPTAEPVPAATPKLMDESGVYFDRTYEAKTYVMGRNSMDASMLGVYEVLFREDGTCDFTMGGTPMKGLSWQKRNGSFVVDYYGMEITFTPSAEGINMDYFGTGILKMELK